MTHYFTESKAAELHALIVRAEASTPKFAVAIRVVLNNAGWHVRTSWKGKPPVRASTSARIAASRSR